MFGLVTQIALAYSLSTVSFFRTLSEDTHFTWNKKPDNTISRFGKKKRKVITTFDTNRVTCLTKTGANIACVFYCRKSIVHARLKKDLLCYPAD